MLFVWVGYRHLCCRLYNPKWVFSCVLRAREVFSDVPQRRWSFSRDVNHDSGVLGFRVQGLGFRVWGLGFWVLGFGLHACVHFSCSFEGGEEERGGFMHACACMCVRMCI